MQPYGRFSKNSVTIGSKFVIYKGMIKAVLLFLTIHAASIGFTQDQLKNTYNTYSEVYGGTESSGVSRTETYTFVAYGSVVIKDIYYNGGQLKLNKGDTLRVN